MAKHKMGYSKEARRARALAFVEAMVRNGGNQTKAAEEIGHKGKDKYQGEKAGQRYMNIPWVREHYKKRVAEELAKAKLTTEEVIQSAARQIRFDPRRLVNRRGGLKRMDDWDDESALAVSAVEIDGVKIRVDRSAAREQLMKHLGLFEKDNAQRPATVVHAPGVRTIKFEPIRARKSGS